MSYVERLIVAVTTAANGTATEFSPVVTGRVGSIQYVKDSANAFADGVDFTVESSMTGTQFWREDNVNASKTVYPVAGATLSNGTPLLHATGGTAVPVPFFVAQDRLKITIADGGNAKSGIFILTIV